MVTGILIVARSRSPTGQYILPQKAETDVYPYRVMSLTMSDVDIHFRPELC